MTKSNKVVETIQQYDDLQKQIDMLKAQQKTVVHECKSQFSEEELKTQVDECKNIIIEIDKKIDDAQAQVNVLKADRRHKQAWVKGRLSILSLKAGHMSRVSASGVYTPSTNVFSWHNEAGLKFEVNVKNDPSWRNGAFKAFLEANGITDGSQRGILHRAKIAVLGE